MADEVVTTETPTAEQPAPSTDTQSQASESVVNPAPEKQGSELSIPKYRFDEVLTQRNQARAREERLMALLEQRDGKPKAEADPDPMPTQDKFDDYGEFIEAKAAWSGRKAGREVIAQERQRDTQQRQAQEEGAQQQRAFQNYHAKTATEDQAFHAAARSLNLGPVLWPVVMEADNPAAIVKHFIANPAEQARIASLPPAKQLIEFGRLETKLAGPNGQPQAQVSQMPKPMKPVGSGKSGDKHPNDYSQDDVTRRLYPT